MQHNCNPILSNTVSGFFGIGGFCIGCAANYDSARVEFYMNKADAKQNKAAFDLLYSHKDEIEKALGVRLTWDRANECRASGISCYLYDVSITNEADCPRMVRFHAEWSDKICNAVIPYLADFMKSL